MTTKIPVELSSTPGIVDGSNATAITIDSSENVTITGDLNVTGSQINTGNTAGDHSEFGTDGSGHTFIDASTSGGNLFLQAGGTTKVTMDSSGNLGIGNTSMSSYDSNARNLVVGSGTGDEGMTIASGSGSGGRIYFADGTSGDAQKADGYIFYNHASTYMAFGTVATERMRIGSGGGVDVGSTSGASAGGVSAYVADNDTAFYANGSNGRVNIKIHTEATGGKIWYFRTGGTAHFGSGGGDLLVVNEAGNSIMTWDSSASTINGDFNDTSDVGLKENIVDITDAITTIKALKPRTFDWKEKTKLQGTHGFIAQEVETVLPNDVVGKNYDANNPEHGSKSLNTSGLLAVAIKAIQEQQEQIEQLKTEIQTLKGE